MNGAIFKMSILNSQMSVYFKSFVIMTSGMGNLFFGQEQSLELSLYGQDIFQTSQILQCMKIGAMRNYNFIIHTPAMLKHYNGLMERILVGLLHMQTVCQLVVAMMMIHLQMKRISTMM